MTIAENLIKDLVFNVKTLDEKVLEMEEVKIKMPFGHIAGKFWGPKNVQPIVCIHGWLDNAGTFDRLIPQLPRHLSYLAIDLLGHGLSSRMPHGIGYNLIDILPILNLIMQEYHWTKISLMGHSMGAILVFIFSSAYPEKVNFAIAIDALKPLFRPQAMIPWMLQTMDKFLIEDNRNQEESEPPAYEYEEMVERLKLGNIGELDSESCHCLLRRGIKKSEKHPNRFYFTRDSRVKNSYYLDFPREVSMELAKRIQMPYLFVKADDSQQFEAQSNVEEILDILKENPHFETFNAPGQHHLHLTNPERVSPEISDFMERHSNNKSKL